ncbi:hypothetical protein V8F33_012583 [Rhypophila sp. PSN 637]
MWGSKDTSILSFYDCLFFFSFVYLDIKRRIPTGTGVLGFLLFDSNPFFFLAYSGAWLLHSLSGVGESKIGFFSCIINLLTVSRRFNLDGQ